MTAQEIIEKIRAEVNRLKPRIRKICGEEVKIPVEKVREKFDTLLSFLSDLEKECAIPNDVENASLIYGQSIHCEYPPVVDAEGGEHPVFDLTAIEDAFKAGWLAHKEKSEKPTTAEGLEEEIQSFASRFYHETGNLPLISDIARHFYEFGQQSKKRELLPMIERICVSCPEKVKAESALNKFISKYCVHCSIEHCPGVKACYTSSNEQLQ